MSLSASLHDDNETYEGKQFIKENIISSTSFRNVNYEGTHSSRTEPHDDVVEVVVVGARRNNFDVVVFLLIYFNFDVVVEVVCAVVVEVEIIIKKVGTQETPYE